jgi:hypothetical protein
MFSVSEDESQGGTKLMLQQADDTIAQIVHAAFDFGSDQAPAVERVFDGGYQVARVDGFAEVILDADGLSAALVFGRCVGGQEDEREQPHSGSARVCCRKV